ncbi:MAG: hypothetical protein IT238_08155 [Bacteroidia bacterium]|nr:hypothetical protein [Bacteroidia bacterium]MCZ2248562.1 hypothetical protein [Bacteroidia bacterium]
MVAAISVECFTLALLI